MTRWALLMVMYGASAWGAEPKRVLYVTHSAGFVHGSIGVSRAVLHKLAMESGKLEITATEDLSYLSGDRLSQFDAVFFFTSGELALSAAQKADLLTFVRSGKGFGGVHSATDTLYAWPEFGDLIGARFDGHPWVQVANIIVEDPFFRGARHLAPSFSALEEFYQFREISRDRVHVLMRLDTSSVNMSAEGIRRSDGDFALAWTAKFGEGRVFYSALGHFDETWNDVRFQQTLLQSLLWLTRQDEPALGPTAPIAALPSP